MIEKLRTLDDIPTNTMLEKNILTICSGYTNKINELVDAVNGMLYWHENLPRFWQNLSQKENTENAYTKTCRMDKEFAEDECVRLQNDLERTRKALDIAVGAMKISNEIVYSAYGSPLKTLKDALEQITALEQKE